MMTDKVCRVVIRGLPHRPEINLREGPGTGHTLLFKAPKGARALVIDILRDATDNGFQGKVYQWLKLRFDDGRIAWARDDLIDLLPGDFSAFGYGVVTRQSYAFALMRDESKRPPPEERTFPPQTTPEPDHAVEGTDESTVPDSQGPLWVPAERQPTPPVEVEEETGPLWIPASDDETQPDLRDALPLAPEPEDVQVPEEVPGFSAVVIGARTRINVRQGPSTGFQVVMRLARGLRVPVLDVKPQAGGGEFRWVKVQHDDQEGWIREDLLHFEGAESVARGLRTAGLYPAPLALGQYWWVRGFTGPQPDHPGWDLGAEQGEPILCGPEGGLVITSFQAVKATPGKPRTLDHNLSLGDPRIFRDEGWGFGYGHYVIVRYTHDHLPAAARNELMVRGLAGAAISVMYAHLHTRTVQAGQVLSAGQQIGTCGTTGNSVAPHLHLEIRAHRNAQETRWASMLPGLMDPGVLFNK